MTAAAEEPAPTPRRQRNPRGQGARLRDEIIDAATAILERTGSEYALSLRGIAREVGVTAPSISAHFTDIFEIIDAVTARETGVLYEGLVAAFDGTSDPLERLLAMCRAYVRYGTERPARYRVLIGRRWMDTWESRQYIAPETSTVMTAALDLVTKAIADCVEAGYSTSADPHYDTLILWFALHGLISVREAIASIDWPEEQTLLVDCVTRAARLTRRPPLPAGPQRGAHSLEARVDIGTGRRSRRSTSDRAAPSPAGGTRPRRP